MIDILRQGFADHGVTIRSATNSDDGRARGAGHLRRDRPRRPPAGCGRVQPLEAARIRPRPILMTTLCTLFGLLPLALGLGAGNKMQEPLALSVIGGLAFSTPLTLFLVPTLLTAIRGADYTLKKPTTDEEGSRRWPHSVQ